MGVPVIRSYDDEEFIPWYREETPGWIELSMAERGALVSIAMRLNRKTGELPLRRGLESLAVLLRTPWGELEPLLRRLLDLGKLSWDAERLTLFDPEHAHRRRRTSADRMRDKRERDRASEPPPSSRDACDASDARDVTPKQEGGVTPLSSPLISSDLKSGRESAEREGPPDPPDWFRSACESVAQQTGEAIEIRPAWLRYWGHRKTSGKRMAQPDAVYWLTTVDAKEAAKERRDRADKRENYARSREGPPLPPKPTPEQSKKFAEELAQRLAGRKGAA